MDRIIHDLREPGVEGIYVRSFQAFFLQACNPRSYLRRSQTAKLVRPEFHDDPAYMHLCLAYG